VASAPNLSKLPPWARDLLEEGRVGRLGLRDEEGQPRVLPITFAVVGDEIWSAVDKKPKRESDRELARLRYLRRDPRAALTVDRYSDDWSQLAWVQALGEVRIVEAGDVTDALRVLSEKYAPYRESAPPGPLLALRPSRCLCWRAAEDA
jgi:PPOX class probable F420-dependent enzyme